MQKITTRKGLEMKADAEATRTLVAARRSIEIGDTVLVIPNTWATVTAIKGEVGELRGNAISVRTESGENMNISGWQYVKPANIDR